MTSDLVERPCQRCSLEREIETARREALEEAARVCEARYMGDNNREDMEARRCAAAIRALMEKGDE